MRSQSATGPCHKPLPYHCPQYGCCKARNHLLLCVSPQDDDEDPFFMPLPTDVVKMADERKFKSLAQPLTAAPTTGEAAPILQMGKGTQTHTQTHTDTHLHAYAHKLGPLLSTVWTCVYVCVCVCACQQLTRAQPWPFHPPPQTGPHQPRTRAPRRPSCQWQTLNLSP